MFLRSSLLRTNVLKYRIKQFHKWLYPSHSMPTDQSMILLPIFYLKNLNSQSKKLYLVKNTKYGNSVNRICPRSTVKNYKVFVSHFFITRINFLTNQFLLFVRGFVPNGYNRYLKSIFYILTKVPFCQSRFFKSQYLRVLEILN